MAYKNLGQGFPEAAVQEILYSPPSGKQAVLSTVQVCNQGSSEATFSLAVVRSGESLSATGGKQWRYWKEPLRGERSFAITLGITLASGEALYGASSNGFMSFNLDGMEV